MQGYETTKEYETWYLSEAGYAVKYSSTKDYGLASQHLDEIQEKHPNSGLQYIVGVSRRIVKEIKT